MVSGLNHGLIGLKANAKVKDVLSQYESREGLLASGAEAVMAEAREYRASDFCGIHREQETLASRSL